MPDVQQIEAAICDDKFFSSGTQYLCAGGQFIHVDDFRLHLCLTTKSNARGRTWKTGGPFPTSSPSALNHIPGCERTEIFFTLRKTTASPERCLSKRICAAKSAGSAADFLATRTASISGSL